MRVMAGPSRFGARQMGCEKMECTSPSRGPTPCAKFTFQILARCVMKAFLLLSPGTSRERAILRRILRWSTDDVHETTDVERVECSADLLEVKGAKKSSKSSPWITVGRDALELLTTAETAISRRAVGIGLYLRSDRSDQQPTTRELAKDVQELSASSAWGSGEWNGDAVACE